MTSLKYLQKFESISHQLAAQGMRMETRQTYGAFASMPNVQVVAVYPAANGLPHYARDAELFIGTLDDLQLWLAGIQWLATYYSMIGIDNGTKRHKIEETESERQLLESLRTGEQPRNLKR